MRAIVLAAGQGFQLGGFNKLLIRHPDDGHTVLEHALAAFAGKDVTLVLGYRAIEVMHQYPRLHYVLNDDWSVSSNALSLGLALDERPAYVVSGDMFFDRALIEFLDDGPENLVLTDSRENRILSAVHCRLDDRRHVVETYQGPVQDSAHPEAIGLFKVSSPSLLAEWKRRCLAYGNLFAGQTLPCDLDPVAAVDRAGHVFDEVNTAEDYRRLAERVAMA
jgi:choline kinase